MRGIATLLCALSVSAASGCCNWCGGCGRCGSGGYPTASAPNYNGASTYATTNSGAPTNDMASTEQAPTSGTGTSVAPASYNEAVPAEPSVEIGAEVPSSRTVRRNVSSSVE